MKDSDLQRIGYIKKYCEKIGDSIARYGDSFEVFSEDWDYCNSVSMSIMQIGEISAKLSEEFKNHTRSQIQWGSIKNMRNMFAHDYASMDKEVIWETAARDIPALLKFCKDVIHKATPQSETPSKKSKDRDAR